MDTTGLLNDLSPSLYDVVPAGFPPPGQVSNLINPPDLVEAGLTVGILGLVLVTVFVAIRLFTKCFLLKKVYPEDYTCLIAWALIVACSGAMIWGSLNQAGRHQWDTTVAQALDLAYYDYWTVILVGYNILFVKISLLQQIRRIFGPVHTSAVYITCTVMLWVNVGFYVSASLAGIFSCHPHQAAWDPRVSGTCINKMLLVVISCGVDWLSDLAILVIPIACTAKLALPFKRKLALCGIFATGIVSLAFAVLRFIWSLPLLQNYDITYNLHVAAFPSAGELTAGIICGCLPCVPRFFEAVRTCSMHNSTANNSPGPSWEKRTSTQQTTSMSNKGSLKYMSWNQSVDDRSSFTDGMRKEIQVPRSLTESTSAKVDAGDTKRMHAGEHKQQTGLRVPYRHHLPGSAPFAPAQARAGASQPGTMPMPMRMEAGELHLTAPPYCMPNDVHQV